MTIVPCSIGFPCTAKPSPVVGSLSCQLPAGHLGGHTARFQNGNEYTWWDEHDTVQHQAAQQGLGSTSNKFPIDVSTYQGEDAPSPHGPYTRPAALSEQRPAPSLDDLHKFIYIAGPFRASSDEERKKNIHRAGSLAYHAMQRGYIPLTVHAAIEAKHLGSDTISEDRERGIQAMASLNYVLGASGGGIWAILQDNHKASTGTRAELEAYLAGWCLATKPMHMYAYTWADWLRIGVVPLPGAEAP